MKLSDILDKLLNLTLEKGYAHLSLREISEPLGLSKGALQYYFPSEHKDGVKVEIARQLVYYGRERRSRYLVYPTQALSGSMIKKREFFARQMAHYLEVSYRGMQVKEWNCPAFVLEQQLGGFLLHDPRDQVFLDLLTQLWGAVFALKVIEARPENLQRLLSGPYPPDRKGVMAFYKF